ncbi:MAG: hypothetical protein LBS73_06415 [Campylobacteraceae bacterium]|jgi:hypothetical protein|nr:hypothetical protein [Campylobacteraceae bacterium]
MKNLYRVFALSFVFILIVGCGGGSGSGGGGITQAVLSVADCSGSNCGVDSNSYTGSGVGVWRYTNTGSGAASLDISLSNVGGKDIMVVFTNEKSSSVFFPTGTMSGKFIATEITQKIEPSTSTFNDIPDHIRYFDKKEMLRQVANSSRHFAIKPSAQKNWLLNAQANWYVDEGTRTRKATLKKQTKSAGRTINVWVENAEFDDAKVTQTMLDSISSRFTNDIYSKVVSIAGEPWGEHNYSNLIGKDQPINIVFTDLPAGVVGYFWAFNNFLVGCNYGDCSNEALVFFADSKTLYLAQDGVNIMLGTLAHELTHMINFYQRDTKMSEDDVYDIFLEEMTAIMMEDVISSQIAPDFNDIRDGNYHNWLSGAHYNCDFTDWENCGTQLVNSYHVAGSFGAYLLRQHGIGFYQNLLKYPMPRPLSINDRSNSITLLNNILKTLNGEGLGRAVQRWGASIALFPATSSPSGFGYPEKIDGSFSLGAFDGNNFQFIRKLPTLQPSTLKGYSHYPVKRNITTNQYEETVAVPSGVSVTVIVK